jgi:hypothetical protein
MRKYLGAIISLALVGVGIVSTAHAEPYGTAGCGLGSIIFGNSTGIVQIFAATTNATFGTQTFGITSGTSNCVNTGSSAQNTKQFIQANRETVSKEIARGAGETLSSISTLAGCKSADAVSATLQTEFKSIFPNEQISDVAVSESLVSTLQAHPELECRSLI